MEDWRDIPGHEGRIQVSSLGRARSVDRKVTYSDGRIGNFKGKLLASSRGTGGYRRIDLGRGLGRMYLHHAVALAFLGPKPPGKECVNHIDGDKFNNAASNLEWATFAENNSHARKTGLQSQHGENCNLTKYSDQLILAMRRVHDKYRPTRRELADLFDVSEMMASQVVRGQTRKHPTSGDVLSRNASGLPRKEGPSPR